MGRLGCQSERMRVSRAQAYSGCTLLVTPEPCTCKRCHAAELSDQQQDWVRNAPGLPTPPPPAISLEVPSREAS